MPRKIEKPHPLAWPIILTTLFSVCAAVCFSSLAVSIVFGMTHSDCPCHPSSDLSETTYRKECCFQSKGDGPCSADQCVCIMAGTDAFSRLLDGLPQLTMDSIRCQNKQRTLTDAAIVGICLFGLLSFGFTVAVICAIWSCCYVNASIAAASLSEVASDGPSVSSSDIEQGELDKDD